MRESKLFKVSPRPVLRKVVAVAKDTSANPNQEDLSAQKKPKGKAKAKTKVPTKGSMGHPKCPITPNIGLRATFYVDDLVNSIEFALRSVELEHVDKFVVDTVIMLGCQVRPGGLSGSYPLL